MYSDVVLNIEHHYFEDILEDYKAENNYLLDTDLNGADWKSIVSLYKEKVKEELADVLAYALLLAEKYGFDVKDILLQKIKKNGFLILLTYHLLKSQLNSI